MAYSSCQRVAQMIPNLLDGASDFDNMGTAATPGSAQLIRFMSSGCAIINAHLQSRGYGIPIGSTSVLYDWLSDVEANYVAYRAEATRSSPRSAAGERSRADMFKRVFDDELEMLMELDLTRMGATLTNDWYVGGRSKSEVDSVESDTDRVEERYKRSQFDSGEVPNPGGESADSQEER